MTRTQTREARSDIRDELDEIAADMIGFAEEARELKERIAAAKARKTELRAKLAKLRRGA